MESFWGFLLSFFIWDTTLIPWAWGEFNKQHLLDDIHTYRLARLVEKYEPELFDRWRYVVLSTAEKAFVQEQKLEQLLDEKESIAALVASSEAAIESLSELLSFAESEIPKKPAYKWYEDWLTIGLSLMLFLGISEFLGIEVQNFNQDKFWLVLLALAGAICLNLGSKLAIIRQVIFTRRYEPRRSFEGEDDHKKTVPFWIRLWKGDPVTWLSVGFIILEMAFAAPGLIDLLPRKLATQLMFKFSVFMAAGFAAYVNVSMAWGVAFEQIRWEQEVVEKTQERQRKVEQQKQDPYYGKIHQEKRQFREELKSAQARFAEINERIKRQERWVYDLKERARREHQRWELAVRRWMLRNPRKVRECNLYYPYVEHNSHSTNGNLKSDVQPRMTSNPSQID